MQQKSTTVAVYAATAAFAAAGLAYIFGPSIFPDDSGHHNVRAGGAIGLSNPANDCFINSVLQALAGVSGLSVYLSELERPERALQDAEKASGEATAGQEQEEQASLSPGNITVVSSATKSILDELNEPAHCRKTISARRFISTLEKVFGGHLSRRQQDAQEFLQIVLEKLEDENEAARKFISASFSVSSDSEKRAPHHLSTFPVTGNISSQIECLRCHYQPTPSKSTFLTLTLNVPYGKSSTTLDACLDGLLKVETIEGYKCARCITARSLQTKQSLLANTPTSSSVYEHVAKSITDLEELLVEPVTPALEARLSDFADSAGDSTNLPSIQKHVSISKFPQVLAIHLSRSVFDPSNFSTKNTAKVEFHENLVLGSLAEKRRTYRLSTMITHKGGHNSGHYETYRRQIERKEPLVGRESPQVDMLSEKVRDSQSRKKSKPNDKWWRISDDKISECKTRDMLSMRREVYLLFYELEE